MVLAIGGAMVTADAFDRQGSASVSLWHATAPPRSPQPPLGGDLDVDVAIVGAGYSGLWTAYYLAQLDPSLRVAIIERDYAGFGASGRNGGWCVGEIAASFAKLEKAGGRDAAIAQQRAVFDTVAEVANVADTEGIDCDFQQGGVLYVARNAPQLDRLRHEIDEYRSRGFGDDDVRLLDAADASTMLNANTVLGGLHIAHAAALHPLKLVNGLADAVVAAGVQLYENTTAIEIQPGTVTTPHGTVRADIVVRAIEGYLPERREAHRELVPMYSLMVATEPLDDATLNEIGLADRPTFADGGHTVIYGQRTADGRIAFGGRGAPYLYGSRIDPKVEHDGEFYDHIADTLRELIPAVRDANIEYRWGGVLGSPRDWFPSVRLDRTKGWATLGGYVGEGVAASNLAGRTLAEMIVGADTERTRLPWVNHRSRRWEIEPLRWLAIRPAMAMVKAADRRETTTNRPSRLGDLVYRLIR